MFWDRFTPTGAYMALLKNGLSPWARAWGTQAMNHTDCVKSPSRPNSRSEMPGSTGQ